MKNFIPYDLYLKLKEKGFNPQKQPNYLYYNGELVEVKNHYNISPYEIAPTIEEVMKWLRMEKDFYVLPELGLVHRNSLNVITHYYRTLIKDMKKDIIYILDNDGEDYELYEFAALAGIKYIIDNWM